MKSTEGKKRALSTEAENIYTEGMVHNINKTKSTTLGEIQRLPISSTSLSLSSDPPDTEPSSDSFSDSSRKIQQDREI